MKKTLLLLTCAVSLMTSCTKTNPVDELASVNTESSAPEGRKCASHEVLQAQLKADPGLAARMNAIEEFTKEYNRNPEAFRLVNGVIQIPVVFNVLYKTAAENVSLTQLNSQITVLNQDFKATNTDYSLTPSIFQAVRSGDINVEFVLDQVIRKSTTKSSWRTDDSMKKTSRGGINPTSPTTKLNIWVCNLSGGILGYAQFPGGSSATDGVVLDDNATGNTGTAAAPYGKGRTATHEVGHWLNLRHIWGDATCGTDQVGDTPTHNTANYGCPTYPHASTCSGAPIEMTMNYMDYTYDECMYMFTAGQKTRMQALFAAGGARNSFAQP